MLIVVSFSQYCKCNISSADEVGNGMCITRNVFVVLGMNDSSMLNRIWFVYMPDISPAACVGRI